MDNQIQDKSTSEDSEAVNLLPASILISALILGGAWIYTARLKISNIPKADVAANLAIEQKSDLEEIVLPKQGILLPVYWNNLGIKLVDAEVIDVEKLKVVYKQRGEELSEEYQIFLSRNDSKFGLKMTETNAGFLLNLFWVLGLTNNNLILDSGEMTNKKYGGAQNFASTGGWTIAKGEAMEHFSRHNFLLLTTEQQMLVEKMAKGIYRPCCNNSTYFPDCNHGMAMLGLLELMASQGVNEQDMWKTALVVNSYWFPDQYLTIASYLENKGIKWTDADPREILGSDYSSASGYARIASQVTQPQQKQTGSGCAIDTGQAIQSRRQQNGCGI